MPEISLKTERLIIQPYNNVYLQNYCKEFTNEITKYQYPDSFPDIASADEVLSGFKADMEAGEMLELVILTPEGEFLGSVEVFGLREETPELGLWLKSEAHGKGYGYEALKSVIEFLNASGKYKYYIYEADVRNTPSIRLAEKFPCEKGGCEEITTESGKYLKLQTYRIFSQPENRL